MESGNGGEHTFETMGSMRCDGRVRWKPLAFLLVLSRSPSATRCFESIDRSIDRTAGGRSTPARRARMPNAQMGFVVSVSVCCVSVRSQAEFDGNPSAGRPASSRSRLAEIIGRRLVAEHRAFFSRPGRESGVLGCWRCVAGWSCVLRGPLWVAARRVLWSLDLFGWGHWILCEREGSRGVPSHRSTDRTKARGKEEARESNALHCVRSIMPCLSDPLGRPTHQSIPRTQTRD